MTPGSSAKKRGTRSEYVVRDIFRSFGWAVVRSGGSLGPVDLVCIKDGKLMLVQVKRCAGGNLHLRAEVPDKMQGFRVTYVADFGKGNIRVVPKVKRVTSKDGILLRDFLASHEER